MEAALGASLLTRGRRGGVPAAAGRVLLHHARQVCAQIERMRGDLRAFLLAHPDVDINIEEMTSAEIVGTVAEGRADFGVIADNTDPGALEVIPLTIERLVLIAASGHALAGRENPAFADLLDEPFMGLSDGALHDHLAGHALRLGRRIIYRVRLRSFDAVMRLVEAGIGIGIVPLTAAWHWQSDGLAIVPLSDVLGAAAAQPLCAPL